MPTSLIPDEPLPEQLRRDFEDLDRRYQELLERRRTLATDPQHFSEAQSFVDRLIGWANRRRPDTAGWSYLLIWYARREFDEGHRDVAELIEKYLENHRPQNRRTLKIALKRGWAYLPDGNTIKSKGCQYAKEFAQQLTPGERRRWTAWLRVIVPITAATGLVAGRNARADESNDHGPESRQDHGAASRTLSGPNRTKAGWVSAALFTAALLALVWLKCVPDTSQPISDANRKDAGISQGSLLAKSTKPARPEPQLLPLSMDAGASPDACGELPPGPQRKNCLIGAAGAVRDQFELSRRLYNYAIDDPFSAAYSAPHPIEGLWLSALQPIKTPAGYNLFRAQNYSATAELASLYAQHGRFPEAIQYWRRAMDIIGTPMNSPFTPWFRDYGDYVRAVLESRAGWHWTPPRRAFYGPYSALLDFQEARERFKSDDLIAALKLVSSALDEAIARSVKGGSNHPHWVGVLPAPEEALRDAEKLGVRIAQRLEERGAAVLVDGIVFWVDVAERAVGASALSQTRLGCTIPGERKNGGFEFTIDGTRWTTGPLPISPDDRMYRGILVLDAGESHSTGAWPGPYPYHAQVLMPTKDATISASAVVKRVGAVMLGVHGGEEMVFHLSEKDSDDRQCSARINAKFCRDSSGGRIVRDGQSCR